MFRKKLNIKNEDEEFKAELYRNRREKIDDIPNDWIGTVKRHTEDIDFFDLKIPKYIQVKEKKKINPTYMKIKPMQHIIVTTTVGDEEKKERFILIEPRSSRSKHNGEKSFKAISFEHTLKNKRTSFEGKVMQLKSDDIHIAEGILDKFARETGWKLGYIDPKSRVELMSTTEKINVDLFNNYNKSTKITDGALLFEKDVTTTIAKDRPLYISFEYKNLTTYDNGVEVIKTPSIFNTLTDALYTNIKKVQAYHYSDVGNRYGIRYVFTLTDNTTVERIAVFTNIINKTFKCENIRLTWETGNIIETENVKYINIENIDSDWYETLRGFQDSFKSVFIFDGYEKTLSVVSRDNLGEEKPYILTYDNAIIDIEDSENTEYITGLKVLGKDGLSIVSENIYGDDIVRDYSEHIKLGIVSEELQSALNRYEAVLITKQQEWLNIRNNKLTEQQKQVRLSSEIKTLQDRIKHLRNLLAGYMNAKDKNNQAIVKKEIDGLESRLNQCNALMLQYKHNIDLIDDELALISKSVKKENVVDGNGKIFTNTDLEELNDIEQIGSYEDDYYTNSFSLLNASKKMLSDRIKRQIDFNLNCVNLCKVIHHSKGWNFILELGSLFKFDESELEDKLGEDVIRLVEYEYEPKTKTISNLIFTNKTYKYEIGRHMADIGRKANATNDILNSLRPIIDDAMLSNNFVAEVLRNGLDLSAHIAKGRGISNYIDISEAGIYLYDQSDMNKAVYIGSSLICITNDGFATSETAISSEGILAKLLVGSVILGEKLYITSEDGSFYIGKMDSKQGFGLSIKDSGQNQRVFLGTEVDSDGVRRAKLKLIGKDGEFALTEEGIISEYQYNDRSHVDPEAPFYSYLRLRNNISKIKEGILTVKFLPFRTYSKGLEYDGGYVNTVTSSDGGTYSNSTAGGGGYYEALSSETNSNYGEKGTTERQISWSDSSQIDIVDGMTLYMDKFAHRHDYYFYTRPHSHLTYISIPTHFHQFYIPNHKHSISINIGKHSHQEKYGCFDLSGSDNRPSSVELYVNNQRVLTNIQNDREIDISAYLLKNQVNEIKFTSSTRGIIHINCYVKSFVLF